MKIGIYEKAMPTSFSWVEKFDLADKSGYDFIEMSVDESDEKLSRLEWTVSSTKKEIKGMRHLIENSRISIPSMCLSGHRRFPLGSRDKNTRDKALEVSKKGIELAYELGVRIIQLAGYDVYYEESGDDTRAYFIEGLTKTLEYAAEAQMCLGVEIMDHHFMSSISKFKAIYDEIPSSWLKVYPDLGNLWAWQPDRVLEELQLCPEHIVGMHLKDILTVKKDFKGQFRDLVLGEGEVDFVRGFQYLMNINYKGPFLIEMWLKDDETHKLKDVLEWVKIKMEEAEYV